MANRVGLILEADTTLNGSGEYDSAWFDSADVKQVRVLCKFGSGGGNIYVLQSNDQTNVYPASVTSNGGVADIGARYFKLHIENGTASTTLQAVLRKVA